MTSVDHDRPWLNTVSPGLVGTSRAEEHYPECEEVRRRMLAFSALRREGTVQELAEVVCFVASDSASCISGQEIHVNGGGFPLLRNPNDW